MNIKVLIVDDEVEFASTLSERLALRDYDVKAVYCAEDAIAVVRSEPPDVVLLDLKMPGMSGLELINIIKQFDPSIQVVILTGQLITQDEAEVISGREFDTITKPVDLGELITRINNACKKRNINQRSGSWKMKKKP